MTAPLARLSILLLTEDRAEQALSTIEALTRKMFRQIDPASDLSPTKVLFEPATDDARAVARANNWKSPTRHNLVAFRQYIAAHLTRGEGFVVFHIDGDRVYAERGTSENVRKFDDLVRRPVRIILEGPPPKRRERQPPPQPRAGVDERLSKLFLLTPFYSIESWLYQNVATAMRLCRQNVACGGKCVARLTAWEADRAALDEVDKPKTSLCFRDRHNAELAGGGFPIAAVLAAKKSLHDVVAVMGRCLALTRALAQTHSAPHGAQAIE